MPVQRVTVQQMMCVALRTCCVLAGAGCVVAAAGCGKGAPPQGGTPPPTFVFDDAVVKAAQDPKYAEFVKVVQARGAAAKAMRQFRATLGATLSDADRAKLAELDAAITSASVAVKAAKAAPGWSADDEKVLNYLFGLHGNG